MFRWNKKLCNKKSNTKTKTPFYLYFARLFTMLLHGTPNTTLYEFFSVLKQIEYKKN
jgi:hypothetical protein